jgi:hypothetical protein
MKVPTSKSFRLPSLYSLSPLPFFLWGTLFPSALRSQQFQYTWYVYFFILGERTGNQIRNYPMLSVSSIDVYMVSLRLTTECRDNLKPATTTSFHVSYGIRSTITGKNTFILRLFARGREDANSWVNISKHSALNCYSDRVRTPMYGYTVMNAE